MIYAGVDIAKYDHVIGAVTDTGKALTKPLAFKNSAEGFKRCLTYLQGLVDDADNILIGLEATGQYWLACFCFLQEKGYNCVVLNPMQTHAMRKLKGSSKVKTDSVDSIIIAETLRFGDYEPSRLADEEMFELRQLTRFQQNLKEDTSDLKRQVITALDQVFPEYETLFSNTFGESSMAFLKRCPTPDECLTLDTRTLTGLLEKASKGKLGKDKAKEIKNRAKDSCGIRFGLATFSFQIKSLINQIVFVESQIGEVDERITTLLEDIEPLILTIPGISYTLGAQIVSEIGDIHRFPDAASLVSYAGINPSVHESGTFKGTKNSISKQGSSYLRRALYLAAQNQCKTKAPLYDYYLKKREEGKPHRVALIAVARKLTHVIYAVLSKQESYNPAH